MAIEKLKPIIRASSVRVADRTRSKSERRTSSSPRRLLITMPMRMESQSTKTEIRKIIRGKFIRLIKAYSLLAGWRLRNSNLRDRSQLDENDPRLRSLTAGTRQLIAKQYLSTEPRL